MEFGQYIKKNSAFFVNILTFKKQGNEKEGPGNI